MLVLVSIAYKYKEVNESSGFLYAQRFYRSKQEKTVLQDLTSDKRNTGLQRLQHNLKMSLRFTYV